MNSLVLLISSLLCAYQCAPVVSDDSTETTTATEDTTLSTGPVDFDAFDADLDDVYKSLAKIKSKASKLEMIGPKIQDAMLHLAGSEEDVAKTLQAKYQQILPLLQQLKIDESVTQKSAANRRRRDVTPEATAAEPTVSETSSTDSGNTEFTTESITVSTAVSDAGNTEFTTESVTVSTAVSDVSVNADIADSSANVTSSPSTSVPSTST